jgi:hypothetical protein
LFRAQSHERAFWSRSWSKRGDIGRVERELDLADEHACSVLAMGRHDVDLGVPIRRRTSPPRLCRLPSHVVDRDLRDTGPDDLLPDLAQVRAPRGLGLHVELPGFEQRPVRIDEAVPVAEKRIGDLVAGGLAVSRMLTEGQLALDEPESTSSASGRIRLVAARPSRPAISELR